MGFIFGLDTLFIKCHQIGMRGTFEFAQTLQTLASGVIRIGI